MSVTACNIFQHICECLGQILTRIMQSRGPAPKIEHPALFIVRHSDFFSPPLVISTLQHSARGYVNRVGVLLTSMENDCLVNQSAKHHPHIYRSAQKSCE